MAAFVHVVRVHAYSSLRAEHDAVLGLVLVPCATLLWARIGRPSTTTRRPYRVLAVRPERSGAVTVELAADGHTGLRFGAGQFARLRLPHAPFGLDDHPFTLSSAAGHPTRPAFTVKALGDFTARLPALEPGSVVLVDGPHGEAIHPGSAGRGLLLVAAGIGITPAMSVLRTAAERGDPRPHLLLYGSRTWADVTFREELAELQRRLPGLRVVHALSRPGPAWRGERGRVGAELLER